MRIAIYPRTSFYGDKYSNPYIDDFIQTLERNGIVVDNQPSKNPLLSVILKSYKSDIYIFHWIESVPDFKHGYLQTMAAIVFLFYLKISGRKIVWFLHNKQSHSAKHRLAKLMITTIIMRIADMIITHSKEGIDVVREKYPQAAARTFFLNHPTKDRITEDNSHATPKTDLLIWGTISPYKRITELARFATRNHWESKIRIIGRCISKDAESELKSLSTINQNISFENRGITFSELKDEIRLCRFVLIPYASESMLSSGLLMDSLSFGASVIGPNVGSFKDYKEEKLLNVYTFDHFKDIPHIVDMAKKKANAHDYHKFLEENNWDSFGSKLHKMMLSLNR